MSKVIGVIPSRYGAQRFPGKPLVNILNQPLLGWVLDGVRESKLLDSILLATDSDRIEQFAESKNVSVAMTSSDLPSGTDRVWAAVKTSDAQWVVNIQGDEPLICGEVIDQLVLGMKDNPDLRFFTMGREMNNDSLESINTAKLVVNCKSEAIYFSRLPIPFTREPFVEGSECVLKHIGIYGFRMDFLKEFCEYGPCELEKKEGLEQLRALYMGEKIKVIKTNFESWGVDTPSDIPIVEEKLMSLKNIKKN